MWAKSVVKARVLLKHLYQDKCNLRLKGVTKNLWYIRVFWMLQFSVPKNARAHG